MVKEKEKEKEKEKKEFMDMTDHTKKTEPFYIDAVMQYPYFECIYS